METDYKSEAIQEADAHLNNAGLPLYGDILQQLRQALPIIDAHRRAALGEGDLTAYNIRCILRMAGVDE